VTLAVEGEVTFEVAPGRRGQVDGCGSCVRRLALQRRDIAVTEDTGYFEAAGR